MMYLPVRLMTFLAAEKLRLYLFAASLDRYAILLPLMTIVALGLGKSLVPSITVAPSRIITPASFCVSFWLDIAVKGLAKAEVTLGEINRKVNATIPTDTTDNCFTVLFFGKVVVNMNLLLDINISYIRR
jgi:hypothetical protein